MGEKLKKRRLKAFGVFLLLFLLLTSSFVVLVLFWPQENPHQVVKVTVKNGVSLNRIAEVLNEQDIISNKLMFRMAVQLLGKEKEIPIGRFRLVNARSNYEIIDQLVYGAPEVKKVRILEGWDLRQIAGHLREVMDFDSSLIMQIATDYKFLKKNGISSSLSLEGYLFPDTYFFFAGDTPRSVLTHLVTMHQSFWKNRHISQAKNLNMTKHEIVTLASIIEGEAIYDSERAKISAVYHNRLNMGMKLQADPTIQFILPEPPRRLLNRDLKIKSPYNTYLNKGLPPGPINSPGKNSILAALYPEKNDFIYFVASGDGYHTFTTNERDHNKAKRKLQKIRRTLKRKNQ